jgi:hypothetical protein
MQKLIPILAGTCVALVSAESLADDRITIGGFAGTHIFSKNLELGAFDSSDADSPRNGLAFGVRVGYELIGPLRLEAELAIIPTKTRESRDDLTVVAWRSHALVDLMPAEKLRPFALLGVGFLTSSPTAPEVLEEDTDLAFHTGIGLELDMAENWSLRADARLLLAPTVESKYLTSDFEFFLGAIKFFPEKPAPLPADDDGDGVFAGDDQCPEEVEEQDGYDDEDGCPDPDNDGDGVPDEEDQCPAEAESQNGIDDEDGCPEADGDGDGVLGSEDKCPREAEDKDGVDDEDGCPDPDPIPEKPDAVTPAINEAVTPAINEADPPKTDTPAEP